MTPELPSPVALGVGYFDEHIFGHTKEQLIEYGKLVESATREECAKLIEQDLDPWECSDYAVNYNTGIKVLADKIRSGT